jgi:hypothetical protein
MNNYFTDEQVINLVNDFAGYESNFNVNSKLALNFDELRRIINLSVSTAIGSPIGTVVGWSDEDGNMPVRWHDTPNYDAELYVVKELPNG